MSNIKKDRNRKKQALQRLESGVAVFNQWRERFPTIRIDFAFEELLAKDLSSINFDAAKLKKINLSGSNLQNSSLRGANLNEANLSKVNASFANFKQARLANANLSNACIDGSNLFATIKEGWNISSVQCSYCWITKDRDHYPDDPDVFMEGEFETIYGGRKFKLRFPGGFQSIDLLALPFHAKRILDEYSGRKIVFTGLSAVGEPGIEFQVYNDADVNVEDIQKRFDELANRVRNEVSSHYEDQLKIKGEVIADQKFLIGTMRSLLEHKKSDGGESDQQNSHNTTINNHYYFDKVNASQEQYSASEIKIRKQFYFDNRDSLMKLACDLEKIRSKLPSIDNEKVKTIKQIEIDAREGDSNKVKTGLLASGKWLLDASTKIGTGVATAAIKAVLGI